MPLQPRVSLRLRPYIIWVLYSLILSAFAHGEGPEVILRETGRIRFQFFDDASGLPALIFEADGIKPSPAFDWTVLKGPEVPKFKAPHITLYLDRLSNGVAEELNEHWSDLLSVFNHSPKPQTLTLCYGEKSYDFSGGEWMLGPHGPGLIIQSPNNTSRQRVPDFYLKWQGPSRGMTFLHQGRTVTADQFFFALSTPDTVHVQP